MITGVHHWRCGRYVASTALTSARSRRLVIPSPLRFSRRCTREFITELRNLIFIGGTGTGKTHLAIAIAMHAVRER